MNTASLQNPAAILQNVPPAAKQNTAAAPQTPFNQVLSKEVENRREDGKVNGNADKAPAAEAAEAATPPATVSRPKSDAKPAADAADTAAAESASIAAVSAELLALVAGLQRGTQGATVHSDADSAADADAEAAELAATARQPGKQDAGIPLPPDVAVLSAKDAVPGAAIPLAANRTAPDASGKTELPASAPATRTDAAKGAASKQETAFAATIKQAEQAADAKPAASALKNLETTLAAAIAQPAPGVLHATQPLGTPAADKLTPQVGTPAWDAALGQKVVWMVAGAQQSASLTLNPPDLGPLQVVLHVSNTHADATFIAAQPEVRQALEAAMPRLREMLNDAGIQLGQASVGTGMPDQQQAPGESPARHASRGLDAPAGAIDAAARPLSAEVSSGRGLVDIFA